MIREVGESTHYHIEIFYGPQISLRTVDSLRRTKASSFTITDFCFNVGAANRRVQPFFSRLGVRDAPAGRDILQDGFGRTRPGYA